LRDLQTARLAHKLLLSRATACFHLEFSLPGLDSFEFTPGQFVSCVATDPRGKQQTRAYSIASAPSGNRFDLCVNRVPGGFFSNLLCDLEPGDSIELHGPHGMFTLQQNDVDALFIAADTGVAPIRAFLQSLFPANQPRRDGSRRISLLCGSDCEESLYYREEFEQLAAQNPGFTYIPTLTAAFGDWHGARGLVEQQVVPHLQAAADQKQQSLSESSAFHYICGLNAMVAPCREQLKNAGIPRKQIVFERYD
jgi:ferredoxin-NADP reductase